MKFLHEEFYSGESLRGSKKKNWRASLHPAEQAWGLHRICIALQPAACGVWRTTTAAGECADGRKWRFTATQWAFQGVPKGWFHGRTRQLSGFHWNLVAFASGKTVWLVAAHESLAMLESLEAASKLGIDSNSIWHALTVEMPTPCNSCNSYRLS